MQFLLFDCKKTIYLKIWTSPPQLITFHMRHSQSEMYIGHGRLCECLSLAAFAHNCTNLDVTWGMVEGAL